LEELNRLGTNFSTATTKGAHEEVPSPPAPSSQENEVIRKKEPAKLRPETAASGITLVNETPAIIISEEDQSAKVSTYLPFSLVIGFLMNF
jgi:hypothetical protein